MCQKPNSKQPMYSGTLRQQHSIPPDIDNETPVAPDRRPSLASSWMKCCDLLRRPFKRYRWYLLIWSTTPRRNSVTFKSTFKEVKCWITHPRFGWMYCQLCKLLPKLLNTLEFANTKALFLLLS